MHKIQPGYEGMYMDRHRRTVMSEKMQCPQKYAEQLVGCVKSVWTCFSNKTLQGHNFARTVVFLNYSEWRQYEKPLGVEASWNVMAHTQKPHFVFRRNGRVHLNLRGALVQSTTGSRGVRISGSNAGYTIFRGSVKATGYPLHLSVSPSPPLLYVTVCHHISAEV